MAVTSGQTIVSGRTLPRTVIAQILPRTYIIATAVSAIFKEQEGRRGLAYACDMVEGMREKGATATRRDLNNQTRVNNYRSSDWEVYSTLSVTFGSISRVVTNTFAGKIVVKLYVNRLQVFQSIFSDVEL